MSVLKANNISLDIKGTSILQDVTAELASGEMVGLIGPNGAGKTSLLKCLLGLHEGFEGVVSIGGTDASTLSLKERAKLVSYAAQGAPVHWPLAVDYVVGLGRVPHLNPWRSLSAEDQQIIDEAIELTDCAHLRDRIVTTLSGGERARVLLARVLAAKTPWILADEPVASLDPSHQLEVMDILKGRAEAGKGVLVVLHDLGLAMRYCDRLILLDGGRLVGQSAPADILSDENLAEVFGVRAHRWQEDGEDFLMVQGLKP